MGVIMLVALVGGIVFGAFLFWQMSQPSAAPHIEVVGVTVESRPPTRALSGAAAPLQGVLAEPTAVPANPAVQPPTAPAAPTATTADQAKVAHTDGTGVVLRASPNDKDRTPRGFMDGDAVTVLERQGADWVRVRGPSGQEGWVPARYLEPR
jgi:hypothetical protein